MEPKVIASLLVVIDVIESIATKTLCRCRDAEEFICEYCLGDGLEQITLKKLREELTKL